MGGRSWPHNPVERTAHSTGSVLVCGSVPVGRRSPGALYSVQDSGLLYLQYLLQVLQGLHTGYCCLGSLDLEVLMKKLVVRIVLMEMLRGEHEGYDRDFSIKLYPHQCVNDGLCDKLMPIDTTVDDKASSNDGGIFSCLR